MNDYPAPFAFPDISDEAVIAINAFLEDSSTHTSKITTSPRCTATTPNDTTGSLQRPNAFASGRPAVLNTRK